MCPPRLNGSIDSSSSSRPHNAPTLVGPHILCDENAKKSQPSAWTSTALCGAACAPSTTMIAPCSCAQAESFSIGLIVPSAFETRLFATTLTRPSRAIESRPDRSSSPLSSSSIIFSVAPVRPAMYCQGTKFEWCSSSVTTTTSPGPRFTSPQAYATRFSPSVAPRTKTISRSEGALTNCASFWRAPSYSAVERSESVYTPRCTFAYEVS